MSPGRRNTCWNIALSLIAVGCVYGMLSYSGGEGTVERQMTFTGLAILFLLAAMGKPATTGLWAALRNHAVPEWYGEQDKSCDLLLALVFFLLIMDGGAEIWAQPVVVQPMPDWYVIVVRTFVFASGCVLAWGCFRSHRSGWGVLWCLVALICDPLVNVEATRDVWGRLIGALLASGNQQQ